MTARLRRSARAAVVTRQSNVTAEAEPGSRDFALHAVRVAAAPREPLRGLKVPAWVMRPGPGTLIRVRTELPVTLVRPSTNWFDGGGGGGGDGSAVKLAVALRAPRTVTVQVAAEPEQLPPHPENEEPEAGVAVSVTFDESAKLAEQAVPQSIPAGAEVTVPLPVPSLVIESG